MSGVMSRCMIEERFVQEHVAVQLVEGCSEAKEHGERGYSENEATLEPGDHWLRALQ